jgi:tetratricopeptide (TPR) repeat protein
MSDEWTLLDEARECAAQNPQRALELENRYIAAHPEDGHGYFSRHLSWMSFEDYDKAMQDCMMSLRLNPAPFSFMARGKIYRAIGDHERAVADFSHFHDLDYEEWRDTLGPYYRADSLARLGRLDEALADCALIEDDHWWPAHRGLPGGDKDEFIMEIRRRAALAQAGQPID